MATRKYLKFAVFITLLLFVVAVPMNAFAKDSIRIGAARSISGPLAFFEATAFGPIYKMWVKEVNAAGGIYVKEYGKKLPIELVVYDDKSDMGTTTRLMEKLILEDKVDLLFPPISTAHLFAAAAVAKKYGYVIIGAEGGATSLEKNLPSVPNLFMMLHYSNRYQMPALADILAEQGVESVAIIYVEDLHGIEYQSQATSELAKKGINVMMLKGVPMDAKDISPLLKEAKKLNVDAFCAFTYPPVTFNVITQSMEMGLNFKAILLGPGANTAAFSKMFGNDIIEGIMGEGAFNLKSTPKMKGFYEKFLKYNPADAFDWWGSATYWASCEILQQAIEKTGTLDQKKLAKYIGTQKFDTVLGTTWFDHQILARECHTGDIGQWQKGIFEVIDVSKKRTAKPEYPKPDFPKAASKK
jgi:branched-chain amino acid transport system substrate-binding protein